MLKPKSLEGDMSDKERHWPLLLYPSENTFNVIADQAGSKCSYPMYSEVARRGAVIREMVRHMGYQIAVGVKKIC
jgi:hypothetical protein